jgi:hypothetical protein
MKLVLPKAIRAKVGTFDLPREILVDFLWKLHNALGDLENTNGMYRNKRGDRCVFRFHCFEEDVEHEFVVKADDRSNPALLIVRQIRHHHRAR